MNSTFRKELIALIPYALLAICLSEILFISFFGFEGRTLLLIVPVPGHCSFLTVSLTFHVVHFRSKIYLTNTVAVPVNSSTSS